MTYKLSSEMSSQKIDLSADIRFGSLTLLGGFVILDLNLFLVTPTEISNTEYRKNYYMTEVMCPMGSFKYNYGMWSLDIC